jgi:hypothetical protein
MESVRTVYGVPISTIPNGTADRRQVSLDLLFTVFAVSRGDTRPAKYNAGAFDIATLAIFPEYIEFDGEEVLRLVVEGAAGRTVT